MLKVVKNIDVAQIESWKEDEIRILNENIIFVPIDAIEIDPNLGELPKEIFEKLDLNNLKTSWRDNAKSLLVKNTDNPTVSRGYYRVNLDVNSGDYLQIKSAVERAIASIFFNIADDMRADFFHSSGEEFHKVIFYGNLGKRILQHNIDEDNLRTIAEKAVRIIRQQETVDCSKK